MNYDDLVVWEQKKKLDFYGHNLAKLANKKE
jgi:hypothetical protein